MQISSGLTSLPACGASLMMPSCLPPTAPPACHYPQHLFDTRLHLDPPAVAISSESPGAQSGSVWGLLASATHTKKGKEKCFST